MERVTLTQLQERYKAEYLEKIAANIQYRRKNIIKKRS